MLCDCSLSSDRALRLRTLNNFYWTYQGSASLPWIKHKSSKSYICNPGISRTAQKKSRCLAFRIPPNLKGTILGRCFSISISKIHIFPTQFIIARHRNNITEWQSNIGLGQCQNMDFSQTRKFLVISRLIRTGLKDNFCLCSNLNCNFDNNAMSSFLTVLFVW